MKNKTFVQSVVCAIKGASYAVKTEKNYKYYLCIALVFLIINVVVKVEFYGYIFFLINAMGVFAAECANTAIEHICNKITKSLDSDIKLIKDISAGNILFWGIAFFVCEFIFIGKSLI